MEDQLNLNDLPEPILEHILWHLGDVKSLVQTGLISRRWKNLWKHAPVPRVVNLCSSLLYFYDREPYLYSVRKAVGCILSRRRVGLEINLEYFKEEYEHGTFASIMAKISCSPPKALSISHSGLEGLDWYDFYELARNIGYYPSIRESLKSVMLERTMICLDDDYLQGFNLLTRLELVECHITCDCHAYNFRLVPSPPPNALSYLHSLKHLKLLDCQSTSLPLKLIAPQLLSLDIGMLGPAVAFRGYPGRRISPGIQLGQVSAPRLQSLRFCCRVRDLSSLLLGELSLPRLDHATVRLIWVDPIDQLGVLGSAFRDVLLLALRNANSLHLCFEIENNQSEEEWKQLSFPRTILKSLIKSQASPFTNLKTLRIQYPTYFELAS